MALGRVASKWCTLSLLATKEQQLHVVDVVVAIVPLETNLQPKPHVHGGRVSVVANERMQVVLFA